MIRSCYLFATLCITAAACTHETPTAPADRVSPAVLRSAPTTLAAGKATLTLEATVWRDFMPSTPPGGRPLVVVARVQTTNGSPVPAAIRATDIFVVFGNDVWSTSAKEERSRTDTAPQYEVVGREGPKWSPDVAVDVILRLSDGSLLRAPNQPISATY